MKSRWLKILLNRLMKLNKMAKTKAQAILSRVGKEIKKNPPAILAKTAAKSGAKQAGKQKVAILLSKARKAGAKI